MSLPIIILLAATISSLIICLTIIISQKKKVKSVEKKFKDQKRNHEYLIYLLHDLEDIAGFGSDYGYIVDIISRSLENTYPHSTISSLMIKEKKLIFKSKINETVNSAFINKLKDAMISLLSPDPNHKLETEEQITGITLDEMAKSEVKSSADILLTVNFKPLAVVNIASTAPDIYSAEDKKIFEAASYLVSGFLSRIEVLIWFEKSKSLAMIDTFTDGLFMIDLDHNLIAMNNSALKFLQIEDKAPNLNQVLASLPNTYNFKEKIDSVIRENLTIEENDVGFGNKYFKIVITPVHEINTLNEDQKTVIGATVLLHDITLEKSLTQMRDDFTNVMVHELRSPLTAIKASSEFLTSKADLTEDEKKKLIQMTSESTNKMLEKISLILDAAKMESGLFAIRKTESDLKELLEGRVAEFGAVAAKKQINFRANIDPAIPIFSFDKTRIDEVVNNLLSNSLKFTPEHGTITLSATLSSDRVIVAVADTGEGIAKDKQGKLFTKYQQAPSESDHVGTGLGLYVVKQVVESHAGTVSLDSEIGRGTTITFTLPLHPLSAALPRITGQSIQTPQKMVN